MSEITPDTVADGIFEMVKEAYGKKKYRPLDLQRAMAEKFEVEKLDKKIFKSAMRLLIDNGRLIYTFYSGSYVEMPHEEKAEL